MDVVSSNYKDVMRKLGKADPELRKALNKELKASMGSVVAESRAVASWSKQIPKAIKPMSTTKGFGVRVSAKVPIAVLNERKAGFWRHPVFGNREKWVSQTARPSVWPIAKLRWEETKKRGDAIVHEALRRAGL